MNQPRYVIHDSPVACILMHDRITHGTKQSAVIFACIFSDNVLSTIKSVIHFECSVHLDARKIQPRYAIHDSLVACILMHDRTTHGTLFTLSEYSRFRATSCTLRSTTKPRTERYLTLFRHFRFRATSCTLRSTINPRTVRNKVRWFLREFFQTTHYQPSRALFISTILAWIQTEATCLTLQGHYDLSRINAVER